MPKVNAKSVRTLIQFTRHDGDYTFRLLEGDMPAKHAEQFLNGFRAHALDAYRGYSTRTTYHGPHPMAWRKGYQFAQTQGRAK